MKNKKHVGYALLVFAALRVYHENVGFKNATLSTLMNTLDLGGPAVTYLSVAGGAYLVWKG